VSHARHDVFVDAHVGEQGGKSTIGSANVVCDDRHVVFRSESDAKRVESVRSRAPQYVSVEEHDV
jgi:hypothetical protein